MVLLAEVIAKWINFDYLSLTSFDFCKSLFAACRRIFAIIVRHIIATAILLLIKCSQNIRRKSAGYLLHI